MARVTVLADFRIEIPPEIREEPDIHPGQEMEMIVLGGRIEMAPVRPVTWLRGRFSGINTDIDRDERDRF